MTCGFFKNSGLVFSADYARDVGVGTTTLHGRNGYRVKSVGCDRAQKRVEVGTTTLHGRKVHMVKIVGVTEHGSGVWRLARIWQIVERGALRSGR